MPSSSEESLRPWSSPQVRLTLEYAVGDRLPHIDPVQSQMWKQRADDLVFWANRRPDVAARMIACMLFSETPVAPRRTTTTAAGTDAGTTPASSASMKLPGKLHAMCTHALAVSAKADPGKSGGTSAPVTAGPQELARAEVTFMATLVEPCVREPPAEVESPNYRRALARLLGASDDPGSVSTSAEDRFQQLVRGALNRALTSTASQSTLSQTNGMSDKSSSDTSSTPYVNIGVPLPHVANVVEMEMLRVPPSYMAMVYDDSEDGQHKQLLPPLPFAVRSHEEVARREMAEEARQRSTTLVRGEGVCGGGVPTIARPQWADRAEAALRTREAAAAAAAVAAAAVVTTPPKPETTAESEQGKRTEGYGGTADTASTPAAAPAVATTVIEEGDLVFQNGRFVVVPPSARRTAKVPAVAGTTRPARSPAQASKTGAEDACASATTGSRRNKRPRSREGAGQRRKKMGPLGDRPLAAAVVAVHDAPLLPREQLVQMVQSLTVSATLREAFLIGLEPLDAPPSEEPSGSPPAPRSPERSTNERAA